MVVAVFLAGPSLNPQISSIHLCFASFGLVFGHKPLWVMPACICTVSWAGGQSGLCHPITVQGTGSLGSPFFCGGCCRPGEHLLQPMGPRTREPGRTSCTEVASEPRQD